MKKTLIEKIESGETLTLVFFKGHDSKSSRYRVNGKTVRMDTAVELLSRYHNTIQSRDSWHIVYVFNN